MSKSNTPESEDAFLTMEGMMNNMAAPIEAIDKFFSNKYVKVALVSGVVTGSVTLLLTGSGSASEIAAGLGGTIGGLVSVYRGANKQRDPNNEHCEIDDVFP